MKEFEHEKIKIRDGVFIDLFVQTKKHCPEKLKREGTFHTIDIYKARFWIEYDFVLFSTVEREQYKMFETHYENVAEQAFELYKKNLPKAKSVREILENPKRFLAKNLE